METFSAIIDEFGGSLEFGAAVGITANYAGVLKHRNWIPPEYWRRTIEAARERRIAGVTYDRLAKLAAGKAEGVSCG